MLISGSPRSGQRYLASCLLHCFVGNGEIQKVDLATISQEGHGDVTQGVTRILRGNDASHSAEATARRGSSSFARPDVDMHSRSGMATLSTIGAVASAMGLAVEKSSKVPDITTALMDAKLGTEGRKDLFDWLSRQLSGLSNFPDAVNLLKPTASAMTDKSADVRKAAEVCIGEIFRVCGPDAVTKNLKDIQGPALAIVLERLKHSGAFQETFEVAKTISMGPSLKSGSKVGKSGSKVHKPDEHPLQHIS